MRPERYKFIMNFINNMKNEMDNRKQLTENGAVGYATTGSRILDMNTKTSSYRNMTDAQIVDDFARAFYEDNLIALKWLFFARDIRGGTGERRLFRAIFLWLSEKYTDIAKRLVPLCLEYGRGDDPVFVAYDSKSAEFKSFVLSFIKEQLRKDYVSAMADKPITILAKWVPKNDASSYKTRMVANWIIQNFDCSPKEYRKMLVFLRKKIYIVETIMSKGNCWDKIEYKKVSSGANKLYNDAFLRHDEERRREFLGKVKTGETTIHSGTLFPHDILVKYHNKNSVDDGLEALWSSLPDYVKEEGSTIVVADGSGSMQIHIGKGELTRLDVANSLAIYFSERCKGQFKDTYISFSMRPELVRLRGSLLEKIRIAKKYNAVQDTNIEAVFNLILNTGVKNKMSQEEMPQNILIISDGEFNGMTSGRTDKAMFDIFAEKFNSAGYQLPRISFWNVSSTTNTIPIKQNENGVSLVSGFSPSVVSMILSKQKDPYLVLLEKLNSDRYKAVEEALR